MNIKIYTERRKTRRKTDMQTKTQIDRHMIDKKTDMHTNRQTNRQEYWHANKMYRQFQTVNQIVTD